MEPVNGYLATDGKFFYSQEECQAHEDKFQCECRRKAVISFFSKGEFASDHGTSLPKDLHDHIKAIDEDDLIELWNGHLLPFLFAERQDSMHSAVIHEIPEMGGSRSTTDPIEFFVLKFEIALKLLAFVLGKNP